MIDASNPRVIITAPVVGFCYMRVCVAGDTTDEEILAVCNRDNPTGAEHGWVEVIRSRADERLAPLPCADNPARLHLMVVC